MTELYDDLETRPYLLYLNQINLPEVSSELPEAEIQNIAESLGKKGVNFSLPPLPFPEFGHSVLPYCRLARNSTD
jgi:hypothetical protein